MKHVDLRGQTFGRLRVAEWIPSRKLWLCQCACGETTYQRTNHLIRVGVATCRLCTWVDLTGQKFGRLTVVSRAPRDKTKISTKGRWSCQCECGKSVVVRTDSLRTGRSTSCGCWLRSARLPQRGAAWNQVWGKHTAGAATRGIPWELTKEHAQQLFMAPCHYCGLPPSQSRSTTRGDKVLFSGLDRLNSDQGYILGNVVPCCKHCNFAKNTMNYEEFREWVRRIYSHFGTTLKAGP